MAREYDISGRAAIGQMKFALFLSWHILDQSAVGSICRYHSCEMSSLIVSKSDYSGVFELLRPESPSTPTEPWISLMLGDCKSNETSKGFLGLFPIIVAGDERNPEYDQISKD